MKLKKYDSINVIPFIDVLLVLLTIVLMTSTFISKGIIPISLPTASNADNIKVNKEIIIIIKEDGKLFSGYYLFLLYFLWSGQHRIKITVSFIQQIYLPKSILRA